MQNAKIMADELMRKAVNYTLNQWRVPRNILKDGAAKYRTTFVKTKELRAR